MDAGIIVKKNTGNQRRPNVPFSMTTILDFIFYSSLSLSDFFLPFFLKNSPPLS